MINDIVQVVFNTDAKPCHESGNVSAWDKNNPPDQLLFQYLLTRLCKYNYYKYYYCKC